MELQLTYCLAPNPGNRLDTCLVHYLKMQTVQVRSDGVNFGFPVALPMAGEVS